MRAETAIEDKGLFSNDFLRCLSVGRWHLGRRKAARAAPPLLRYLGAMAAASFDPFEVLGLERGATKDQIRTAYRELVARYHPDKHRGNPLEELAAAKLIEINRAYALLSDDEERAAFEARGQVSRPSAPQAPASPPPAMPQQLSKLLNSVGVIVKLALFPPIRPRSRARHLDGDSILDAEGSDLRDCRHSGDHDRRELPDARAQEIVALAMARRIVEHLGNESPPSRPCLRLVAAHSCRSPAPSGGLLRWCSVGPSDHSSASHYGNNGRSEAAHRYGRKLGALR